MESSEQWGTGIKNFTENVKWNGQFRSDRSNRVKWSISKVGTVFSKLFRLDRADPFSFRSKFPEILVEWIAPIVPSSSAHVTRALRGCFLGDLFCRFNTWELAQTLINWMNYREMSSQTSAKQTNARTQPATEQTDARKSRPSLAVQTISGKFEQKRQLRQEQRRLKNDFTFILWISKNLDSFSLSITVRVESEVF